MLISCFHRCSCFHIICRIDHDHSRDFSHQTDIFETLVCCSVFSNRDTSVCCSDFYIQMRISDRITNLLISTSCCKHCKRTDKWNFSACCNTRCDTCHICLCNTNIPMALRESFFEHTCLGCAC